MVAAESGARLPADLVILAIGVRPEIALAKEAGLAIGARGGIVVDAQMRTSDPNIWAVGDAGGAWWEQLLNWRIAAGFASFAVAALFYTIVLRSVPLNVAQSFTAAQFVAIILASAFVLSEPIGALRWLGIALIACGIAIVGWSQP